MVLLDFLSSLDCWEASCVFSDYFVLGLLEQSINLNFITLTREDQSTGSFKSDV